MQTVKDNGQHKKPKEKKDKLRKKTLNRTEHPIKIQFLQRQKKRRRKQKNDKITAAKEKLNKIKLTTRDPALFDSVKILKEKKNYTK